MKSPKPKYTTVIPTRGEAGNVLAMLGTAQALMRQLGEDKVTIHDLATHVLEADSPEEARAAIRKWFPLEGEK